MKNKYHEFLADWHTGKETANKKQVVEEQEKQKGEEHIPWKFF